MPERRILLVGTFVSASHHVHNAAEDLAERLGMRGWKVTTTSYKTGRKSRIVDMIATTWRQKRDYDIAQVDVFSGPAFAWAEAVCWTLRRLAKPYVLFLRGGNLPDFARLHPDRVKSLLETATEVMAPSEYLKEELAPYRKEILLLNNPLDLGRYRFRARAKPAPRLVWLRAFHAIYNPELAVTVARELRQQFADLRLIMVGPDRDGSMETTRAAATNLGVIEHIDFPGGVPNHRVPCWLDRGDIFINTTNIDNTPVTVMEAMASGMCIVSTDVGGIPYLLEHDRDSLLVPPRDPKAMAAAVTRILLEPGLAERLSCNARQKAERFDWSVILPRWERILTTAMNHG